MDPQYANLVTHLEQRFGLPQGLLPHLVDAESGWNTHAQSPVGALGLGQLMPATAKALGVRDPFDPVQNLTGTAKYLSDQLKAFGGHTESALAAYNAGPGAVRKYGGVPPYKETQAYVNKIMGAWGGQGQTTPQVSVPGQAITVPGSQQQVPQGRANRIMQLYGDEPMLGQAAIAHLQSTMPRTPDRTMMLPGQSPVPAGPGAGLPGGVVQWGNTPVAGWIAPYLNYAQQHGWGGHVTSGFRTLAQQQSIWNSGVRPAAQPGTSNHERSEWPYGAIDVSDAAGLAAILRSYPGGSQLVWAGPKDPVHFSHPHDGGY